MKKFHKLNGYVLVRMPKHPRAFTAGAAGRNGHEGYVYEHIVVAERSLGRPLKRLEVVHHLDVVRSNNRPSNLLVLERGQHAKLHVWLNTIGYDEQLKKHKEFIYVKIPRCGNCKSPIEDGHKFCSQDCKREHHTLTVDSKRPSKTKMHKMLSKMSWLEVGRRIGLSDVGARKYAKRIGLNPKHYARGKYVGAR